VAISLELELGDLFIKNRRLSSPMQWELANKTNSNSVLMSRSMRYDHEVRAAYSSINADFLWLFEATELPKEAFNYGLGRLRRLGQDAYYPKILETNPSHKQHWIYQLFIDGATETYREPDDTWWIQEKRLEQRIGNEVFDLRVKIIHTTTLANPHFPKSQLALIMNTYSPAEIARLIYGEWNANEGRVIEYYTCFPMPANPKAYTTKYDRVLIGCDPGFDHPTAIAFIGQAGDNWEVFDEIYEREKSVRLIYEQVLQRLETWGIAPKNTIINIDPHGSGWIAEWQAIPEQQIWSFKALQKGTDPALNRALRIAEKLRIHKLKVNEICKHTLADLEQTVYKKGGKEAIDKQSYDPHALDALGYGIIGFI